jgi:hypothetical protein
MAIEGYQWAKSPPVIVSGGNRQASASGMDIREFDRR